MLYRILVLVALVQLSACAGNLVEPPGMRSVAPVLETAGFNSDDPFIADVAVWRNSNPGQRSLLVTAEGSAGLSVHDLAGHRLHTMPGNFSAVDLRENFRLGDQWAILVAALDAAGMVHFFTLDTRRAELAEAPLGNMRTGMAEPTNLCLYQPRNGALQLNITGSSGDLQRIAVESLSGRLRFETVKTETFASGLSDCVGDDLLGKIHVSETRLGVWKLNGDALSDELPSLVVPVNSWLKEPVGRIALYQGKGSRGYLLVRSGGNDSLLVYRREGLNGYVGALKIESDPLLEIDQLTSTDYFAVAGGSFGSGLPSGLLLVADEENFAADGKRNFKIVSWGDVAARLKLD